MRSSPARCCASSLRTGDMTIRIGSGNDKTDAMLSAVRAGPHGGLLHEGDLIRVYVVEVRRSTNAARRSLSPGRTPAWSSACLSWRFRRSPPASSRSSPSPARQAPAPSWPSAPRRTGIDPVGACVGTRGGQESAAVVNELRGEKMDIIVWSEDPAKFVAAALSPADVKSVTLLPGSAKACRVIVPDDQLSLAIGKEGQNARLGRPSDRLQDRHQARRRRRQELEAIDAQPDEAPEDDRAAGVSLLLKRRRAYAEKNSHAPMRWLPGNEGEKRTGPRGQKPGGGNFPRFPGQGARPRRICLPAAPNASGGRSSPGRSSGGLTARSRRRSTISSLREWRRAIMTDQQQKALRLLGLARRARTSGDRRGAGRHRLPQRQGEASDRSA